MRKILVTLLLSALTIPVTLAAADPSAAPPKRTSAVSPKKPLAKKRPAKTTSATSAKKKPATPAKKRPVASAKKPAVRKRSVASAKAPPLPELPGKMPEIGYPLAEIKPGELHSEFNDHRRGHTHHAIDLMRPRGTPVMAVTDGVIHKLYRSRTGGISIYLFDGSEEYCYFYGHLDHYAKDLHEGQEVHEGDLIGYVGSTGNARRSSPHLHFAVSLTGAERKWSGGVPIDPYLMLVAAAVPPPSAPTGGTVAGTETVADSETTAVTSGGGSVQE